MQHIHRASLAASILRVALHIARCTLARRRWFIEFDGFLWSIIHD